MIEARREPTTLLNIAVHVEPHEQQTFLKALRQLASDRGFQVDEVRLPELEGRSQLSGITRVILTKGGERLYAINAGSRVDYTISLSTYRRGEEAKITLRRLADELKTYLKREGLETGKEEFHPAP